MPILDSLVEPHIEIRNKRIEAYKKVLNQCHNHMNMLSRHKKVECKFTIPRILFEGGYPPINYDECFNYIKEHLEKEGIDVERLSINEIFISWEYITNKKLT